MICLSWHATILLLLSSHAINRSGRCEHVVARGQSMQLQQPKFAALHRTYAVSAGADRYALRIQHSVTESLLCSAHSMYNAVLLGWIISALALSQSVCALVAACRPSRKGCGRQWLSQ